MIKQHNRIEWILLFMLVSWGTIRCLFEWAGLLLFPGSEYYSEGDMAFYVRVFLVFGLAGMMVGISTWAALRWVGLNPGRNMLFILTVGFSLSWLAGIACVLFLLTPEDYLSWQIGFSTIGIFCGLTSSLALRKMSLNFGIKKLVILTITTGFIFWLGFLVDVGTRPDLEQWYSFTTITVIVGFINSAVAGLLFTLVLFRVTEIDESPSMPWIAIGIGALGFVIGDILSTGVIYEAFGENDSVLWYSLPLMGAIWGISLALPHREIRKMAFFGVLGAVGAFLGWLVWNGLKQTYGIVDENFTFFHLTIGICFGVCLTIGIRRFSVILLIPVFTVLAFQVQALIPYPEEWHTFAWWSVEAVRTALLGVVVILAVNYFGLIHSQNKAIKQAH